MKRHLHCDGSSGYPGPYWFELAFDGWLHWVPCPFSRMGRYS